MLELDAQVVYEPIEGGIWGLASEEGGLFRPINGLPHAMRKEGLPVHVQMKPIMAPSFAMWGRSVELLSIEQR